MMISVQKDSIEEVKHMLKLIISKLPFWIFKGLRNLHPHDKDIPLAISKLLEAKENRGKVIETEPEHGSIIPSSEQVGRRVHDNYVTTKTESDVPGGYELHEEENVVYNPYYVQKETDNIHQERVKQIKFSSNKRSDFKLTILSTDVEILKMGKALRYYHPKLGCALKVQTLPSKNSNMMMETLQDNSSREEGVSTCSNDAYLEMNMQETLPDQVGFISTDSDMLDACSSVNRDSGDCASFIFSSSACDSHLTTMDHATTRKFRHKRRHAHSDNETINPLFEKDEIMFNTCLCLFVYYKKKNWKV